MSAISAVETSITLKSYDESGVARIAGGDLYFLHIEQYCIVSNNYRCDLSDQQDSVATNPALGNSLPSITSMTDLGSGSYTVKYNIPQDGTISVSIVLARPGGLAAEYFNNAFLDGAPAIQRVDQKFDFTWGDGLLTQQAGDFVSIHWHGKLRAPYSEDYTFFFKGDDGFRVYVDNKLRVDRWNACCLDQTLVLALKANTFYNILIEFKEL